MLGWRRGGFGEGTVGTSAGSPLQLVCTPLSKGIKLSFLILRGWMVPLLQEMSPTFLQQLHHFTQPPAMHKISHVATSPPTCIMVHFSNIIITSWV